MMILRGMPRKRPRSLDGMGNDPYLDPTYDPYAGHTSGTTDSGAVEVGVVPYRPSVTYVQQPGQPIKPAAPSLPPYVGPAPAPGIKIVPWVIRDASGRIVKGGYREEPVARKQMERKEIEAREVAEAERRQQLQDEFKKKLEEGRQKAASAKEQAARDRADQILVQQKEMIERKFTNPYKKAEALERLQQQYLQVVDASIRREAVAARPASDLASAIANAARRANSRGVQAMRASPGIAPVDAMSFLKQPPTPRITVVQGGEEIMIEK